MCHLEQRDGGNVERQGLCGRCNLPRIRHEGARLSNLLVTGNRYLPSDATKAGTAGIRFGGANDNTTVENCTVVGNTVVGSLPDDSAGIFCTSWHCMLRNNLIVGNVETEKAGGTCTSVRLDVSDGSNYQYRNNITDDAQIGGSATKSTDNLVVSGWKSLFGNPAAGDYTLKPGSVACNRGRRASRCDRRSI